MKKFSTLTSCALFTALISIGAQISIPLPLDMRLTLQMSVVLLCGMALGSKRAAVSTTVYLIAGLLGLPVFTNFSGGLAYAARPTFGFIVAFVPAAFVTGLLCERTGKLTVSICMMAAAVGFAIIYAIGILYHFLAFALWLRSPKEFLPLFLGAGYPLLIPKDFAAAALVSLIGPRIKKYSMEDFT